MFLMMGVNLFTSRIILDKIGISDFGIYNLVGGVVAMFSFVSASLQSATQRFFAYSLGQNDLLGFNKAFNSSFVIYLLLGLFMIVGGETIGLYFVYEKLNLGNISLDRVIYVFHLSIATTVLLMLRIPYISGITSQEKMSIFAYNSIFEALLKLVVVYILTIGNSDKLILYSWLIFLVTLIVNMVYIFQCNRINKELYSLNFIIEKNIFRSIITFSGWRVLGAFSQMAEKQGTNIAINIIGGTAANAALGLATQVNVAISSLLSGFQQSFTPVLTKLYASNNSPELIKGLTYSSIISFILISTCCIPIILNIDFILNLWLVEVPENTGIFCVIYLVCIIIEAYSTPLYTIILATGSIAKYQIYLSAITLSELVIVVIFTILGYTPLLILLPKVVLSVILLLWRLFILRKILIFPIKNYTLRVIVIPIFLFSLVLLGMTIVINNCDDIKKMLYSIGFTFFIYPLLLYIFLLNREEKKLFKSFIINKIKCSQS